MCDKLILMYVKVACIEEYTVEPPAPPNNPPGEIENGFKF